jgi:hypothetical protein
MRLGFSEHTVSDIGKLAGSVEFDEVLEEHALDQSRV